jgi:hypothetical protein
MLLLNVRLGCKCLTQNVIIMPACFFIISSVLFFPSLILYWLISVGILAPLHDQDNSAWSSEFKVPFNSLVLTVRLVSYKLGDSLKNREK